MTTRIVMCNWVAPDRELHDCEAEPTKVEVFTDAVVFEQHDGSRQVYDLKELTEALGYHVVLSTREVA